MLVDDLVREEQAPRDASAWRVVRVGELARRAEAREARKRERDLVRLHARLGELASVREID